CWVTAPVPEKLAAIGPSLISMRPEILPSGCGGPSSWAPGMQRATASGSDISAQTASRGCSRMKIWARLVVPSRSSMAPVETRGGAGLGGEGPLGRVAEGVPAPLGLTLLVACPAEMVSEGLTLAPGPGAGPSH